MSNRYQQYQKNTAFYALIIRIQDIHISLKDKISHNNIAKALSRSQPSISREIARNKGQKGYRYQQADNRAVSRHKEKEKSIKLTETVRAKIVHYIKEDWSPEQICGWLKKEGEVDTPRNHLSLSFK